MSRICYFLIRIRIRTTRLRSGSCFFFIGFQDATKTFCSFSPSCLAYYVHTRTYRRWVPYSYSHQSSNFKDSKLWRSHKTVEIKVYLKFFPWRCENNNYGSGFGRPKILRIPIRNTVITNHHPKPLLSRFEHYTGTYTANWQILFLDLGVLVHSKALLYIVLLLLLYIVYNRPPGTTGAGRT